MSDSDELAFVVVSPLPEAALIVRTVLSVKWVTALDSCSSSLYLVLFEAEAFCVRVEVTER